MQNPLKRKEPTHSSYSSWKKQMVATSFMFNIREDLAMLRKKRTWIVKAGSSITDVFKVPSEWFRQSLF